MSLALNEHVDIFDDLFFDVRGGARLGDDGDECVKELLSGFGLLLDGEEEVDESASVSDLVLDRVFGGLVWQILQKEVEEV